LTPFEREMLMDQAKSRISMLEEMMAQAALAFEEDEDDHNDSRDQPGAYQLDTARLLGLAAPQSDTKAAPEPQRGSLRTAAVNLRAGDNRFMPLQQLADFLYGATTQGSWAAQQGKADNGSSNLLSMAMGGVDPDVVKEELDVVADKGRGQAARMDKQWLRYLAQDVFGVDIADLSGSSAKGQDRFDELHNILRMQDTLMELQQRRDTTAENTAELRKCAKQRLPQAKQSARQIESKVMARIEDKVRKDFIEETVLLVRRAKDRNIASGEMLSTLRGTRRFRLEKLQHLLKKLEALQAQWGPRQADRLREEVVALRTKAKELNRKLEDARRSGEDLRIKLAEAKDALKESHPSAALQEQLRMDVDLTNGTVLSCPSMVEVVHEALAHVAATDKLGGPLPRDALDLSAELIEHPWEGVEMPGSWERRVPPRAFFRYAGVPARSASRTAHGMPAAWMRGSPTCRR